jgi:hypothetical protein
MRTLTARWRWFLDFGLLLACATGCGKTGTHSDFLPTEDKAQKALEAALTAWQNGERVGKIEGASPAIEVVDSKWKAGQKLQSYRILQVVPSDGPTHFVVRLTLKQPRGEQEARYVVLGRDPLWVYREEDYKRLSGL